MSNNNGWLINANALFGIIASIVVILGFFGISHFFKQEKETVNESISQPTTIENKDNTYNVEKNREQNSNETQVNSNINQNQPVINSESVTPANVSVSSNQNINVQQPQIADCEKNNTGDYCFTNNTNVEIKVLLMKESSGSAPSDYPDYWNIDKEMLIQPGKSQCFYDITANVKSYGVYGQVYTNNHWIIISGAQIRVNKCKSETISVDGTYKHYSGY